MVRTYLSILLSLLCFLGIHAQKLNVESFVVKSNDITARTQPRQDINGNDCALVKVHLAASNAVFEGNVIGDVAYNTSEYLVYMAQDSKKLTVKLEGYLPLEVGFQDYNIKSLESKTVYLLTISGVMRDKEQEPVRTKTGWIILDSEPSGASVYINNEFVGNTPLSNYKQAYGTYQYKLESPNYHPATGVIELNAGRYEQKIVLKPAFGSISVNSSIAGAKILLDGKQTGKQTPATLTEISSGSHTISLQLDKYAPKQQEVIVEDGQTANVSMTLDARFARITISTLDGAEIYSNGKLLGKGRISEEMMEGYYDLEARLNHHKSVTKQIQVVAGQSQDIMLNLIPKYGSLDIMSTPHDAIISIDGREIGKTPFTIEKLLEGDHTVAISKEGYSVFKKVVNITEDNTETIYATMEKGIQFSKNDGDSSIKLVGPLTDKDWGKLKKLLKDNKEIRSVDLSKAECETIPDYAFSNDSNLVSIILPNGLTSIDSWAFKGCINLTSITIPNSVSTIGFDAFEKTGWFDSQPSGLVYAGRVAYGYKGKIPNGTRIILKDGTIGIAAGAFWGCHGITSITIPEGVTNIGNCAFRATSLTDITIPNSVKEIGSGAFENCEKLNNVSLPNSINSIKGDTFRGCSNLTTIIIPNSVTTIEDYSFLSCRNLISVTIPNSVRNIGYRAFGYCSNLTIYVPKGSISLLDKSKNEIMRIVEMK